MSEPAHQLVRPGFILALVSAVGLVFILFIVPDPLPAGGRAKLPRVTANLKQIDLAKQMWASDHAATNGAIVTEQELMQYLRVPGRTGLVASVDSEIYRAN